MSRKNKAISSGYYRVIVCGGVGTRLPPAFVALGLGKPIAFTP
jgi:hypothetical protein